MSQFGISRPSLMPISGDPLTPKPLFRLDPRYLAKRGLLSRLEQFNQIAGGVVRFNPKCAKAGHSA